MPRNMKTGEDFPKWESKEKKPELKYTPKKNYDSYADNVAYFSVLFVVVAICACWFSINNYRMKRAERPVFNATIDAEYQYNPDESYGSIGNDLRMIFTINGESVWNHGKTTIRPDEKIVIIAKIIEDDSTYVDVGTVKIKYRTPDAISHGDWFLLSSTIKVEENGGNQYSKGCYAVFDISFKISVK